jgi:hypothetical protein
MTLHSEIWRKSIIGLSVEEIAADLAAAIDRAIVVPDKVAFVTACLANVRRDPNLALDYTPLPWADPYVPPRPQWVPATEARHRDMEERFLNGETPEEIAESYGLSCPQTIIKHLRRRGVLKREITPRVQNVAPKKLSSYPILEVAGAQEAWEFRQAILRARRTGMTLKSLGDSIGRSQERVRQMVMKAERQEGKPSPLEKWMADQSYLRDLADLIGRCS